MWVRSQDRKKLTEIHDVTIYHDKQIWAGCSFIGEYSTEEKALKVLDEIQKYIGSERFYSTTKGISEQQSISIENTNVFKMPQDEDVEV